MPQQHVLQLPHLLPPARASAELLGEPHSPRRVCAERSVRAGPAAAAAAARPSAARAAAAVLHLRCAFGPHRRAAGAAAPRPAEAAARQDPGVHLGAAAGLDQLVRAADLVLGALGGRGAQLDVLLGVLGTGVHLVHVLHALLSAGCVGPRASGAECHLLYDGRREGRHRFSHGWRDRCIC